MWDSSTERPLTQPEQQGRSSKVMHGLTYASAQLCTLYIACTTVKLIAMDLLQSSIVEKCCSSSIAATPGRPSAPPSRSWRLRASASSGSLSAWVMTPQLHTLQPHCPAQPTSQPRTWRATAPVLARCQRVTARTAAPHLRLNQRPPARMAARIPWLSRNSRNSNAASSSIQLRLRWLQRKPRRLPSQGSVPVHENERRLSLHSAASTPRTAANHCKSWPPRRLQQEPRRRLKAARQLRQSRARHTRRKAAQRGQIWRVARGRRHPPPQNLSQNRAAQHKRAHPAQRCPTQNPARRSRTMRGRPEPRGGRPGRRLAASTWSRSSQVPRRPGGKPAWQERVLTSSARTRGSRAWRRRRQP